MDTVHFGKTSTSHELPSHDFVKQPFVLLNMDTLHIGKASISHELQSYGCVGGLFEEVIEVEAVGFVVEEE